MIRLGTTTTPFPVSSEGRDSSGLGRVREEDRRVSRYLSCLLIGRTEFSRSVSLHGIEV